MNQAQKETNSSTQNALQEMILVVKREHLFPEGAWQGIKNVCFQTYTDIIKTNQKFILRADAEHDTNYKQIIPYLIFEYNEQYFLMQRSEYASEKRLQNKYSLGIGGHVNKEDLAGSTLFEWATREFNEEISYAGGFTIEPLGILNDDSNPVGQVHIGFVLLLKGDSNLITIKSELKKGSLVPLEECMLYNKDLESWSQLVLQYLLDLKYGTEPAQCCCK